MFIEEFLLPVSVGLATALILWMVNKFKQPITQPIVLYLEKRRSIRSIKKWRKAAEKRRGQPDYKTDKETLAEAIREYQETGECTTIPKETLEMLLRMGKNPPIIHPTKPNRRM